MNTQELTNPIFCLKEVLNSVMARTAEVQARLDALIKEADILAFGSIEEKMNYSEQCRARGELLGLAHAEGALRGRISVTEIWMS